MAARHMVELTLTVARHVGADAPTASVAVAVRDRRGRAEIQRQTETGPTSVAARSDTCRRRAGEGEAHPSLHSILYLF